MSVPEELDICLKTLKDIEFDVQVYNKFVGSVFNEYDLDTRYPHRYADEELGFNVFTSFDLLDILEVVPDETSHLLRCLVKGGLVEEAKYVLHYYATSYSDASSYRSVVIATAHVCVEVGDLEMLDHIVTKYMERRDVAQLKESLGLHASRSYVNVPMVSYLLNMGIVRDADGTWMDAIDPREFGYVLHSFVLNNHVSAVKLLTSHGVPYDMLYCAEICAGRGYSEMGKLFDTVTELRAVTGTRKVTFDSFHTCQMLHSTVVKLYRHVVNCTEKSDRDVNYDAPRHTGSISVEDMYKCLHKNNYKEWYAFYYNHIVYGDLDTALACLDVDCTLLVRYNVNTDILKLLVHVGDMNRIHAFVKAGGAENRPTPIGTVDCCSYYSPMRVALEKAGMGKSKQETVDYLTEIQMGGNL